MKYVFHYIIDTHNLCRASASR
eukprot:COSAG02_NODE_58671_length_276_cov_1.169492_1_plen_21_part_01